MGDDKTYSETRLRVGLLDWLLRSLVSDGGPRLVETNEIDLVAMYKKRVLKKGRVCGETVVQLAKGESIAFLVAAVMALETSAVERHRRQVEWTSSEKVQILQMAGAVSRVLWVLLRAAWG